MDMIGNMEFFYKALMSDISFHYIFILFFAVACSPLTDLKNGVMTCSLEDDGVPSYKDTCSFTCNIGYEITGSDTRICGSNRKWSGRRTICRRGIVL